MVISVKKEEENWKITNYHKTFNIKKGLEQMITKIKEELNSKQLLVEVPNAYPNDFKKLGEEIETLPPKHFIREKLKTWDAGSTIYEV